MFAEIAKIDMIEEDKSFKAVYAKSIAPVLTIVENIFKRYVWSKRPVVTHPPTSDNEIAEIFKVFRKISPSIVENTLQIDSANIRKHLGI